MLTICKLFNKDSKVYLKKRKENLATIRTIVPEYSIDMQGRRVGVLDRRVRVLDRWVSVR